MKASAVRYIKVKVTVKRKEKNTNVKSQKMYEGWRSKIHKGKGDSKKKREEYKREKSKDVAKYNRQ
jgi:hypothetical protein